VIKAAPSTFPAVGFFPRKVNAIKTARATLSLSMGATREPRPVEGGLSHSLHENDAPGEEDDDHSAEGDRQVTKAPKKAERTAYPAQFMQS
jgi:hypothetical protein